ncbi:MAG TPA: ATP-binding protein [Thermodesulfovibrionales bacterium]|nr:ATP-binding protein [Thermodesulfovibrionales bacterium]
MFKKLWVKFFLLSLVVSVVALSSSLIVRELMVQDFRGYLEGQLEDRAYWITASLESTYEKYGVWANPEIIENTIWALMLGFDMRLHDADGNVIIDTEGAANTLSPLVRKRIEAISELRVRDTKDNYEPYALFYAGKEIGRVELKFLRSRKEMIFITRSNRLLSLTLFALGGFAILLSVIFSRRLTRPIHGLTEGVTAIAEGNLRSRVVMSSEDEIGRLSAAFNRMAQALELQESLRKKLTSHIAHELRTPLSAIRGELEGMIDGFMPMDKDHLQSLYAEIGRLRSILEGIEELSRAEASGLTLNKQVLDLGPFLNSIVGRFSRIFQDKGVAIQLRCDDNLRVRADPDKLSQIIINLVSNSLKATDKGGNVRIEAAGNKSDVIIEVIDNGCGITQKDLPFIFERFYKASEGGLGLGLTIVKELVDAHGGTIEARSEYGKRTTFTLSLPL